MQHELTDPHVANWLIQVQLEGLNVGGLTLSEEAVQRHSASTVVMSLIFAIEHVDGEDLVLKVLSELLVLSHLTGLQRIDFLLNCKSSVQNLLVCWLRRSDKFELILLNEMVLPGQLNLRDFKLAVLHALGRSQSNHVSGDSLKSVELELEEDRLRHGIHIGW